MANSHRSSTDLSGEGTIESLKLKVGDHQAHYLKTGSGPPVVLVHGGASDSTEWGGTMAALRHSHSLYAPDLVGYGLSDKHKSGYHLSEFIGFTLGFVQALGLDSPALVGHSLGGRVCLQVALRYPEIVRRLVLIDTVGFGKLARWGTFLGAALWGVRKVLRRPQPYPKFVNGDGDAKDWMCLEELPGLKVPTLIVWNRHDPYCPMSGALRAKELIPKARLEVLPGYGHAPHVQKRDSVNSLLLSFLNDE